MFFIRGIGDSDPIFDPNVAVYVDDVYLPRAINGMTDLTDIERVEVLRGPQGTLFGENADAGAIRYVTKTPTDQTEASFDIGGGTYNAFNAHGYLSGALIPGLLDGSLAIAHDQHDGYTWDPTLNEHVNNQNTTGAKGKLLPATLTPDLSLLLTVDGTVDSSGSDYYSPVRPIIGGTLQSPVYGQTNLNDSYASQSPTNNSWSGGASLKAAYNINPNLTFNSITSYRGFAQDPVNYNNDGQPLVPYSNANPTPVSISDNYIVYREKEATQEFQLLGKYDHFDFTSGLLLPLRGLLEQPDRLCGLPHGRDSCAGLPRRPDRRHQDHQLRRLHSGRLSRDRSADRHARPALHHRKPRVQLPGRLRHPGGSPHHPGPRRGRLDGGRLRGRQRFHL